MVAKIVKFLTRVLFFAQPYIMVAALYFDPNYDFIIDGYVCLPIILTFVICLMVELFNFLQFCETEKAKEFMRQEEGNQEERLIILGEDGNLYLDKENVNKAIIKLWEYEEKEHEHKLNKYIKETFNNEEQ